jgi:hypothetical protein
MMGGLGRNQHPDFQADPKQALSVGIFAGIFLFFLQQHFEEVSSHEEYTRWVAGYEQTKVKRDAAAEELRTIYPEIVTKLTDLLLRIETIDREVERVRSAKPFDAKEANGDGRWLLETELTARGLDDFRVHDLKIMQDLKLPSFSDPTKLAWPVQKLPDWSSVVPVRPHPGADWWQAKHAENARRRAEDEKRAEALHEEARVRNDPKLWRRG